ncbi:endocuticle structural glycoprotein SgAbd-5-like [Pectinophora gossypiella]|uniref:endocuticle structural glycoprotein SgAbd-5-like n=1 Tax=Pectinophora gossypiella TaxID=13191 RepID=UPI00214ED9BD|nr:endocuticle structural glycoprotein SgAbd-5-like [Pectinophora gossypiella]
MLRALLILVAISSTTTAPAYDRSKDAQDEIIDYVYENTGQGGYFFRYVTKNGLMREENGYQVNVGEPDQHIVVNGEYSYRDPEGNLHIIRYTADENGYKPEFEDEVPATAVEAISLPGPLVATLLGG